MTTPTPAQRLAAEGIADYAQDLRQLSAEELRGLFAFASSGKINATRVIKNLIWQAYTAIRAGQRAPVAGNLRSFWYTDIKPVLSRLGVPVEGRRATELVYDAFVELVTRHHLFHYRDLGFLDEGAQTRAVGQTNGTLILEKSRWVPHSLLWGGKRAARRAATISVWPTKQVLMPFMT
jgi:hypothetical protein